MTRNEKLNPEIGWASKVPDNHHHKSSRHINLWLQEALQMVKTQDKNSYRKGVPHSGWWKGQHSIFEIPLSLSGCTGQEIVWRYHPSVPPNTWRPHLRCNRHRDQQHLNHLLLGCRLALIKEFLQHLAHTPSPDTHHSS